MEKINNSLKNITIVSGLSGSGKTSCIQVLLDLDYVILSSLASNNYYEILKKIIDDSNNEKIAIILNVISEKKYKLEYEAIKKTIENYQDYSINQIYITADKDVLINRYRENRKIHPYSYHVDMSMETAKAIDKEIQITKEFKKDSNFVIDTSSLIVLETKKILLEYLNEEKDFVINIFSFGFKYRTQSNSDFLFDLRFLPNPFYVPELKNKTGEEKEVSDYVFKSDPAEEIYQNIVNIVDKSIPGYKGVGKVLLNISFGCTGGKHRSVAFARRLAQHFSDEYSVNLIHTEKERNNW